MKLITKEVEAITPKLRTQSEAGLDSLMLYVKLFTPWANWTWYIAEADYETGECFGLVIGFEKELGYFDLDELKQLTGFGGLKVERDRHFKPMLYNDVMKLEGHGDGFMNFKGA